MGKHDCTYSFPRPPSSLHTVLCCNIVVICNVCWACLSFHCAEIFNNNDDISNNISRLTEWSVSHQLGVHYSAGTRMRTTELKYEESAFFVALPLDLSDRIIIKNIICEQSAQRVPTQNVCFSIILIFSEFQWSEISFPRYAIAVFIFAYLKTPSQLNDLEKRSFWIINTSKKQTSTSTKCFLYFRSFVLLPIKNSVSKNIAKRTTTLFFSNLNKCYWILNSVEDSCRLAAGHFRLLEVDNGVVLEWKSVQYTCTHSTLSDGFN